LILFYSYQLINNICFIHNNIPNYTNHILFLTKNELCNFRYKIYNRYYHLFDNCLHIFSKYDHLIISSVVLMLYILIHIKYIHNCNRYRDYHFNYYNLLIWEHIFDFLIHILVYIHHMNWMLIVYHRNPFFKHMCFKLITIHHYILCINHYLIIYNW